MAVKNTPDRSQPETQKPFFTRFLETQALPQIRTDIKAGPRFPIVTHKWPSDDDEGGPVM